MNQLPRTLPAFLWHFIRPRWGRFVILTIAFLAWPLSETASPYFTKKIVDAVMQASGNKDYLLSLVKAPFLGIALVWLLGEIGFRTYDYLSAKLYPNFRASIRMAMFDYTLGHSHRYFSEHFAGSIANKVNQMPRSAEEVVGVTIYCIIPVFVAFIISFVMLWQIHHIFTLVLLGWFILHIGGMIYTAFICMHYSEAHADALSDLSGKIVDICGNILNIKLFAHDYSERRYAQKYQDIEVEKSQANMLYVFRMKAVFGFMSATMGVVWWSVTIYGVTKGWVSAGDVALLFSLQRNLMGLAWYLGERFFNFFENAGICKDALELVNAPHEITEVPNAATLEVKHGEITFNNVNFNYIKGRNIFKNKTLTIHAGEKIGLVGFSGSGKSTFVNLILRFYDVESGQICIDGQNIAEVTQDSLHRAIAMIPQDTSLFHRTLMENIRYGREEASDEEVIEASKKAHCHEFITAVPEGYSALVGERGVKLSGGQRQRIAIARAMLKDAPILILDEATSSLDSVTEKYIQEGLNELMRNRTTIVIAHRLSTLYGMDRVLVFKAGKIIEEGSHTTLLAQKGHYAEMWNMQAGGFLPEKEE